MAAQGREHRVGALLELSDRRLPDTEALCRLLMSQFPGPAEQLQRQALRLQQVCLIRFLAC
jgi:hypothetical protein